MNEFLNQDYIETEKTKLIEIAKRKDDLLDHQVLKQSRKIDKLIIGDLKRQLNKKINPNP